MNVNPEWSQNWNETAAVSRSVDWQREQDIAFETIDAVAEVMDRNPDRMDPLETVVETDALDSLFVPNNSSDRSAGVVKFEYESCLVRVTADGEIHVVPPEIWSTQGSDD